jgi:uncharacterized protein
MNQIQSLRSRRKFLKGAGLLPGLPAMLPPALAAPQSTSPKTVPPMTTNAESAMEPIPYGSVKAAGEIGRRIELTIAANLLKLNVEGEFLGPLSRQKGNYVGVGILLDAASRLAVATSDERIKAVRDRVGQTLIAAQEGDGYIGYKAPADRVWKLFDPDESAQIILGLVTHHQLTGDPKSLPAARRLGDFLIRKLRADPAQTKKGLADVLQWLCLDQAILALHAATGERDYLDFCVRDRQLAEWPGPIVTGRHGPIEGHAYGHLAKCLAQLRLYHQTRDERLLEPARRLIDFLMQCDGMVISGAVGEQECWHDTQDGTSWLGETCASVYLVLLLDALLRLGRDSVHGDLMERIVLNSLFAAQSPDGRHIRYYTAFEGRRSYYKADTYCCPNNYRRAIAHLPQLLYYRDNGGITINLYTQSSAEVALAGGFRVTLRQETDYPTSGKVLLHVEAPREMKFPLRLRIPSWCKAARVAVNGKPVNGLVASGRFFAIERDWKAGDRVELDLPMSWRWVKGRGAQIGRVALMRGPLVFCLNPSRNKDVAGSDLRRLFINWETLKDPVADHSIRPKGIKALIGGKLFGVSDFAPAKPDASFELTEFIDGGQPDGPAKGWAIEERDGPQATYFRVPNLSDARFEEDELLGHGAKRTRGANP